ncbi:AAA family ATPase [Spiroplasma sp. SV19]|uniref:AAA family ATPase n=1 Tax=Spiroplasma sp. SV19 TaxID=2570468 RepID=UPI0024B73501|nr:AAA family ATPase [Spiroplasma sp. SV19]
MNNFLIKTIKFSGFRKFDKEVEIKFDTNKNLYNYKHSIKEIKFKNNETKDFNSVIGIIGANASGKSTILELFLKYQQFNETGLIFNKEIINPIGMKYRSQQKIFNQSDFNTNSNCIRIMVFFATDDGNYTHEVIIRNPHFFEETIFKNKEIIWQQVNGDLPKLNFLRFYLLANSQIKKNESNQFINLLTDEANTFGEMLLKMFKSFFSFNLILEKQYLIDESLNELFLHSTRNSESQQLLQQKINIIISTIDPSVRGVSFQVKKITDPYNFNKTIKQLSIQHVELKDGTKIPFFLLSEGTLKFMSKILMLLRITEKLETYSYILIDELDNSWHPNLTRFFIRLFKANFFKNIILIFTAHNPYIFEEVRKDAIYIIDRDNNVTSFNELRWNNKPIRNDFKFSKNYFDEVIGSHPSNDDFENFCEEMI